MYPRYSWLGALIVGVILVVVANYVPQQPVPLPTVENVIGWILIVVSVIAFIFHLIGGGFNNRRL